MKSLKLALKKQSIVYVARDLERALGLSKGYSDYHIITNKASLSQSSKVKSQKNIVGIKSNRLLDTHELLTHPKTIAFLKKLKKPHILVFKNTSTIEKICKENDWELLNPSAALSNKIEEKISQVEWLGELKKLLPSHRIDLCKNIKWENAISSPARGEVGRGGSTKFILQFNRAHTGNGTLLIESEKQLQELQQKFPDRPVRVTEFIDGPMFTNNNVVWGKKVLCGNINYQITGLVPFTDRPFATIGNDWGLPHKLLNKKLQKEYLKIAEAVGKKLARDGWKGLFGIDVILDQKKKKLYLIEINARQPASTTYESQLQITQRETRNAKCITTFEAHLASLLELKYEDEELIKINDGAQIIQRITKNIRYPISDIKKIVEKLERLKCNVIMYNNEQEGDDLIRIQSKNGIMEDSSELNELGKKIKQSL